jgi:hypothetical protein
MSPFTIGMIAGILMGIAIAVAVAEHLGFFPENPPGKPRKRG